VKTSVERVGGPPPHSTVSPSSSSRGVLPVRSLATASRDSSIFSGVVASRTSRMPAAACRRLAVYSATYSARRVDIIGSFKGFGRVSGQRVEVPRQPVLPPHPASQPVVPVGIRFPTSTSHRKLIDWQSKRLAEFAQFSIVKKKDTGWSLASTNREKLSSRQFRSSAFAAEYPSSRLKFPLGFILLMRGLKIGRPGLHHAPFNLGLRHASMRPRVVRPVSVGPSPHLRAAASRNTTGSGFECLLR